MIDKPYTLINGDSGEVLKTLESDSVDLTVTSPPYDNLRTYLGYSWDFETIAQELFRVTKTGGVVVWVVGDETNQFCESLTSFKQALVFKEIGFNVLDTMIYLKENYAPAYPTLRRYANQFEFMFVFLKGKPQAFNPVQCKKVRSKTERGCKMRQKNGELTESKIIVPTKDTKDLSNVWQIPTDKSKDARNHPAIFPEKLAQDHILSWSNEGDTILDPFCGSGTTGKMALLNNRKFIGIDISNEYLEEIARPRIESALNAQPLFATA